jgi:hypothetical protein
VQAFELFDHHPARGWKVVNPTRINIQQILGDHLNFFGL